MSGIKEVILSEQKLHPHTDGFNYFLDIGEHFGMPKE